jgi:FkbM family methyltransferase
MHARRYLTIVRAQERPFRFVFARLLRKTGLCRIFTIQQGGYQLRFHPSNLAEQLWVKPWSRKDALEFFRAYLKPGDKVIDVGANIGDTVLTASISVASEGWVWAIEPHPRTFRFLKANLALNHVTNVEAINHAAGDMSGAVGFSDDRRDDMNRVGGGTLSVPVHPLDELVPCRDTIALLKVDVEGYEKQVFSGARRLLRTTRCLHFEISRTHFSWFGYQVRDLLQLLKSEGFHLFRISSNGLAGIDIGYDTDVVENLVGLKDPADFRERTGWTIDSWTSSRNTGPFRSQQH